MREDVLAFYCWARAVEHGQPSDYRPTVADCLALLMGLHRPDPMNLHTTNFHIRR